MPHVIRVPSQDESDRDCAMFVFQHCSANIKASAQGSSWKLGQGLSQNHMEAAARMVVEVRGQNLSVTRLWRNFWLDHTTGMKIRSIDVCLETFQIWGFWKIAIWAKMWKQIFPTVVHLDYSALKKNLLHKTQDFLCPQCILYSKVDVSSWHCWSWQFSSDKSHKRELSALLWVFTVIQFPLLDATSIEQESEWSFAWSIMCHWSWEIELEPQACVQNWTMWTILRPKGSTQASQKSKTTTAEQMQKALFRQLWNIRDEVSNFPNLSNNTLTIDKYLNALLSVVSWNKKRIPFRFTIGGFKLVVQSLELSVLLWKQGKKTFDTVEYFAEPNFSIKTSRLISTKTCLFRSCWSSTSAIRDTMLTQ